MLSEGWQVVRHRASATAMHALVPPVDTRVAWWLEVDAPALALGSTQPDDVADRDACVAAGVEVTRRRSGGGAVLLVPDGVAWLDVVLPRSDRLWDDDIGRSMWWLGEVWAEALAAVGVGGVDVDVEVHRGSPQHTPWSRLVCFDGLGAGEVTIDGRKAVGISQRRTRQWCRLQSSAYITSAAADPRRLAALLSPPAPTGDQLRTPAVVHVPLYTLQHAVTAALHQR